MISFKQAMIKHVLNRRVLILFLIIALINPTVAFSKELQSFLLLDNIVNISAKHNIRIEYKNVKITSRIETWFIPIEALTKYGKLFRRFDIYLNGKYVVKGVEPREILRGEEYVSIDGTIKCVINFLDFKSVVWSYPKAEIPRVECFFKWVKVRVKVFKEKTITRHKIF